MANLDAEAAITDALFDKVENLSLVPAIKIAYPNVAFTPETEPAGDGTTRPKPYLVADVIFNTSAAAGISFDSPTEHVGLLALNLVWPAGQGVLKPLQFANQIVGALRAGTTIVRNGVEVRVYERPRVAPYQQDNDRVTVPITVSWRCCSPAAA